MIPRILVCTPIYQGMSAPAVNARDEMFAAAGAAKVLGKYSVKSMTFGPRTAIRRARNEACESLKVLAATHMYFADDDIVMQPDVLDHLLAVDADIVGSFCLRDDGIPAVFHREPLRNNIVPWVDCPRHGSFECEAVGSASMLIRAAVIHKLSYPWFYYQRDGYTMDVNFCVDAKLKGFNVWCSADASIQQINHKIQLV